jgi:hypothetical protein
MVREKQICGGKLFLRLRGKRITDYAASLEILWNNCKILYHYIGIVTQKCIFVKTHRTMHLWYMCFTAYKFYQHSTLMIYLL